MKKNKLFQILTLSYFYGSFLILGLIPNTAFGELSVTYSINSTTIQKIEDFIDEDTIVLIEIDRTLIIPKSLMFNHNSLHKNFIQNMLGMSEKFPVFKNSIENWYKQRELMLVEEDWPNFIERIKATGAKVYGFCSLPFYIKDIEKIILSQLNALGIRFSEKVNQDIVLKIGERGSQVSAFYNGILFTGPFGKAKCFLNFMKISNISPKKVVTFDNVKFTLKDMEDALKQYNIDFYNVEYLAAKELPGAPNENIIKFQQKKLIEEGIWLEDDKAKNLLERN